MFIEKNGNYYEVTEKTKHWSVVKKGGALTVEVKVSKDICKTEEELKLYIKKENVF